MTDSKPSRRGRPPKYAHLGNEELKELARQQAAKRQARKRERERSQFAEVREELAATRTALDAAQGELATKSRRLAEATLVLRAMTEDIVAAMGRSEVSESFLRSLLEGRRAVLPRRSEAAAGVGYAEAKAVYEDHVANMLRAAKGEPGWEFLEAGFDPVAPWDAQDWQAIWYSDFRGHVENGPPDAKMRFLTMFSGIGAPDYAYMRRGWHCVGHAEIEKFQSKVLATRFPGVPNLGDVTAVNWVKFRQEHGPVHVVVGGAPCQSFSIAGKQRGLEDPRGDLSLQFFRICRDLKAAAFVYENVPAILSAPKKGDRGSDFALILEAVAEAGYTAAWATVDAQNYGLPQRRKRLYMVGARVPSWQEVTFAALGRIAGEFKGPEALLRRDGKKARNGRTLDIGSSAADLAAAVKGRWGAAGILHNGRIYTADGFEPPPAARPEDLYSFMDFHTEDPSLVSDTALDRLVNKVHAGKDGGDVGRLKAAVAARRSGAPDGPPYAAAVSATLTKSQSINTKAGHGFLVADRGENLRKLTPGERERLQGFPPGWTAVPWKGGRVAGRTLRCEAVGNSMAVPILEALAPMLEQAVRGVAIHTALSGDSEG